MTVSLQNPADIVNASLVRIGKKQLIGSLRDGSEPAQMAIAIYGQTRDNLLRSGDWMFAQREIALTLLKFAPAAYVPGSSPWDPTTNPPVSWRYEYGWPENCLKVRSLRTAPIFVPNFDPSPNTFSIANDNYFTPPQRVILSNVQNAIATYTGRVVDPTEWPVDFTETLVGKLGENLAAALTGMDAAKLEAVQSSSDKVSAEMEQG